MLHDGKVAVVTGAGSGIGRSSATRFAAEGAAVVVADVRGDKTQKVAALIVDAGGRATASETDVTDPVQVEAMLTQAVREFGALDVVFNNAGVSRPGSAVVLATADWDEMWRTNVSSLFHAAKVSVPL